MKSYRVEVKPPRRAAAGLAAAAEELAGAGVPVRCVRSEYSPEDGTCVLILEADSAEAVAEAGRRAQLEVVCIHETRSER